MKRNTTILSLIAVLFLTGCSFKPELQVPNTELPTTSQNALHVEEMWWKKFGDAKLDALIEEALKNSDDLKLSALKVLKARQTYGLSDANLYPTLGANAGASRQQTSKETYQHKRDEYSDLTMGLSLAYEIDFWGKLSNQAESNWSAYLATKSASQTVKNSLINDIILAYFNLASLDERIKILENTIITYKESYEFRLKQQKAGTINELLATQALAQYNNTKSAKESLIESKTTGLSALYILLGKTPKALFEEEKIIPSKLPKSVLVPKGIPSSLLENRPDIQESLANLKSKNALIGVEKSAYFPSISLTGSYGQQSESLSNILQSSANRWSFGPSLSVPIFDFGRIKTRVAISETDLKSSLVGYEQVVKKAYKEVYDALARQEILKNKVAFSEDEVKAYQKILEITTLRFEKGIANHLEVLDAQKGLLSASINLVNAKQAYLVSQAELFKALGGGWNETILLKD